MPKENEKEEPARKIVGYYAMGDSPYHEENGTACEYPNDRPQEESKEDCDE